MVRSTSHKRKRNKASKATKLFWKERKNETSSREIPNIYADMNMNSSTTCEAVSLETIPEASNSSQPGMERPLIGSTADEEESEVQQLLRCIPQWGQKKYDAKCMFRQEQPTQNSELSTVEYESILNHELSYETQTPIPSTVSGNRIVELGYIVLETCLSIQYRHLQKCTCGEVKLKEEKHLKGLLSVLILECTQCGKIFSVNTENPSKSTSTINTGAVWGTMATGSSYSHLQELLSCLDVPVMSDYTFYDLENKMGDVWLQSLEKSMKEAGLREKENALENNQISPDGTPWITVYVDGSWSKRSYGNNYNSLSGMVGIIGKFTGQLLYVSVRNKYCSICARSENSLKPATNHTCFKNWTGSSPGMESNMVVQGFCDSIRTHGIKYKQFIADGDSSVFARIQEQVPYGHEVQKIECTNHALKNYGKNLRKIKQDKNIISSGRKFLSIRNIDLLTKRAKCSIYEHSKTDQNVSLLQEDLRNGVHHVFGDHSRCRTDICNTVGNTTNSKIAELKSSLVYNHIMGVINLLIKKASLLIKNENNNRAERLMNIVARFNMGKRLNLVQRGSYQRRVLLSSLRYNKSLKWHASPWKRFTGQSPGKYFKNFLNKDLTRVKTCKRKLFKEKTKKANTDYGALADQPQEDNEIIAMEADLLMQQLQVTAEDCERICLESVGQFGNPCFEEERRLRLTASLFGRVIKKRPYTSCHNIVKSCLYTQNIHSEALEYGITKEDVAIDLFEKEKKLKVCKTGLWIDIDYGFLAASPDGIVENDSLVEVKCLYSVSTSNWRTIGEIIDNTPTSKICLQKVGSVISLKRNHQYYYQVQGQLNIAKKDKCYFVVYINDRIKIFIEEIKRDDTLWASEMLPLLSTFYKYCVAPEIIRENIKKGKKCVDPPYILNAMAERKDTVEKKKLKKQECEEEEEIIIMIVDSDQD